MKKMNRKSALALLLCFTFVFTACLPAQAEEPGLKKRGIAAFTTDYRKGNVYSTVNGVQFINSAYADDADTVQVVAVPESGYSFDYFTDNGTVINGSQYYTFCPNGNNHTIAAYFVAKSGSKKQEKEKEKDWDGHGINFANSACIFAPGYQEDTVSVTTNIVAQGKKCVEAFDLVREDFSYVGMYNISFSRVGKIVDKLSRPTLLIFDIPAQFQKPGREFRMLRVYQGMPVALPDMDDRDNKVTFETDCTAAYALVYRDQPLF